MITLSALTGPELASVDATLSALDAMLELLLQRHAVSASGINLEALYEAVGEELQRRAMEDAEYHVQLAVNRGDLIEVIRPDGEIGYGLPDNE